MDLPTATSSPPLADAMEVDKQLTPFLENYALASPDPTPRPSLKRCRSSPTPSPPNTSNQNPNLFFSRSPSPFVLPSSDIASLTVLKLPPATEKNSPSPPPLPQLSTTEINSFPHSDQSSSMPPPCINTDPTTSLAIQEAISHGGDLPISKTVPITSFVNQQAISHGGDPSPPFLTNECQALFLEHSWPK